MSRRPRKKEDWGGEGSDEEADSGNQAGASSGLAGLRAPKLSSSSRRVAEGDAEDSGEDSGADSGAEGDAAAEDVTSNKRERKKATGGRDHEVVGNARLKAQGISMDDKDEDDEEAAANGGSDEEEEKASHRKPAAAAAASAADSAMGDVDDADAPPDVDDKQALRRKMKALFDKKKDDKYMTFDAEDPLKPNPNKRRAAEREDENLAEEEDNKDPWLIQAREDSERAAALAAERGGDRDSIVTHFSTHNKAGKGAPLVSSTAIFDGEDAAPIFNQAAARIVLLKHMKPGETVIKTVKRLGVPIMIGGGAQGQGAAAAPAPAPHVLKTKMKNVRSKPKDSDSAAAAAAAAPVAQLDPMAEKARKLAFAEVTEAAQGFLGSGYVEIYGDTMEKLATLVAAHKAHEAQIAARNQARNAAAAGGAGAMAAAPSAGADARARAAARLQRKRDARAAGLPEPESSDDDDDDAPSARPAAAAAASSAAAASPSAAVSAAASPSSVRWLYKWSASDPDLQGPFDSAKMAAWRAAGLVDNKCVVQRVEAGLSDEQAKQTSSQRTWIAITQVDFQQPDAAPKPAVAATAAANNSNSASASDGHAKKKFKF